MLSPRRRISPLSGGKSPVATLKKVVFPAPFGPMRPMIPPSGMTRSTSLTAVRPPKRFVTLRASRIDRRPSDGGPDRSRSHTGMSSARAGGGAAARATASACSSTSMAGGRVRRTASPSGLKIMTSASPRPKKNQRHSVRSTVVNAAIPTVRPIQRTRNVIWARRMRSKSVISIPPRMTPLMLPMPPSTTMHRRMIDTWNSKAPGVIAWSLAA